MSGRSVIPEGWLSLKPKPPNGRWRNTKSGNVREGWWEYYWPSDCFYVHIKGCPKQRVYGEEPEYGDWEMVKG